MTSDIFLLLGTNLGDKKKNLDLAKIQITKSVGKVTKLSRIYETAAWGKTDQPSFYNQVLKVTSNLKPQELLNKLLDIEANLGRVRLEKWGERLIDIDILYFGSIIITSQRLTIPHPEIHNRRFTLEPLAEIANDFVHPALNKSSEELLLICQDPLAVSPVRIPLKEN